VSEWNYSIIERDNLCIYTSSRSLLLFFFCADTPFVMATNDEPAKSLAFPSVTRQKSLRDHKAGI